MSRQPPEEEFVTRLKTALDEGTGRLDGHVLSRLNQARHAALEELSAVRPRRWLWVPVAAVATVAATVVVLRLAGPGRVPDGLPAVASQVDDLEIMLAEEDLELLEELEFYAWLDLQGDIG